MKSYETEICFKIMCKVLIFAEISDLVQKFLLNHLSRLKCILRLKYQFSVEISGRCRNFWPNWFFYLKEGVSGYVSKTYFPLTAIHILGWKLSRFENFKFLKKKVAQLQNVKNIPWNVEISADLKILGILKLGPK